MTVKTKVYASTVLPDALRERGFSVKVGWEIEGPKSTPIAWLTGYIVGTRVIIVQTFDDGQGWQAFIDSPTITVDATIEEVINALQ